MKLLSETNLSSDWMRKIELQERELNDLSVVDRLKEFLSGNESDRSFDLGWWADRETDERVESADEGSWDTSLQGWKASQRAFWGKERWKKAYYIENAEKEELKLDNQFLSRTISVMQKAFDKVELSEGS